LGMDGRARRLHEFALAGDDQAQWQADGHRGEGFGRGIEGQGAHRHMLIPAYNLRQETRAYGVVAGMNARRNSSICDSTDARDAPPGVARLSILCSHVPSWASAGPSAGWMSLAMFCGTRSSGTCSCSAARTNRPINP